MTVLKAKPHGSFSTLPVMSFQHRSRLFFMPNLKAAFAPFHASCNRASPFERVNFRRAARHSRRRAANWSFHQYILALACLRLRRGIKQSQAATTFCLAERTVAFNDSAGQIQPSSSVSLVSLILSVLFATAPGAMDVTKAPEASGDFQVFADAARNPPDLDLT